MFGCARQNRLPLFAVLRLDARLARAAAASLRDVAEAEPAARRRRAGDVADLELITVFFRLAGSARSRRGRRLRRRPVRLLGRAQAIGARRGSRLNVKLRDVRIGGIVEVGTLGSKTRFASQECTARRCTPQSLNYWTPDGTADLILGDYTT